MKRIAVAVVSIGTVVAGVAMLAAAGQLRPGEMTQARVWIENRSKSEAVPVMIHGLDDLEKPLRVEIVGTPTVGIAPTTVAQVRVVRQTWDHRTVTIAAGADVEASLRQAGLEGWEAVGFQPAPQGGMLVLMKRPR